MRASVLLFATTALFVSACGDDAAETDNTADGNAADTSVDAEGSDAAADTVAPDVVDAEGSDDASDAATDDAEGSDAAADAEADVSPPPEYVREYPDTAEFAAPEGKRWARSIVHLHSTHSHDACDDEPRPDGQYNQPCIESLRMALCDIHMDVAYLTDHPTHMTEVPFVDLLLHAEGSGDELLIDELERPYANWLTCDDGHRVLLRAGSEDSLMPIGLHGHVAETQEERQRIQNERTEESANIMRSVGALVWQAHCEQREYENLSEFELDGMEIYQLHANIAPNIREEFLGLDPVGVFTELYDILTGRSPLPPDLAFLIFVDENRPSLNRWAALLQTQEITGTGGTDAHENTFPNIASDNERVDSYRRMMSWFANYLLVDGDLTPESAHEALDRGRVAVVFDVLGAMDGFDAAAYVGDVRYEMGATTTWAEGTELRFVVPAMTGPTGIAANIQGIVYRGEGESWVQVGDRVGVGAHTVAIDEPGVYRVELRTTGEHLAPFFTRYEYLIEREYVWIYSNAWRLLAD
jgi:hypothetical protein